MEKEIIGEINPSTGSKLSVCVHEEQIILVEEDNARVLNRISLDEARILKLLRYLNSWQAEKAGVRDTMVNLNGSDPYGQSDTAGAQTEAQAATEGGKGVSETETPQVDAETVSA